MVCRWPQKVSVFSNLCIYSLFFKKVVFYCSPVYCFSLSFLQNKEYNSLASFLNLHPPCIFRFDLKNELKSMLTFMFLSVPTIWKGGLS